MYFIQLTYYNSINQTKSSKLIMQENFNQKESKFTERASIIINADDYGYCHERSQGIRQLIEMECITSTTVIINAPQIQEQCALLIQTVNTTQNKLRYQCKQHIGQYCQSNRSDDKGIKQVIQPRKHQNQQISIGLHLNFTQFSPLSNPQFRQKITIMDHQTNTFKGKQYVYENMETILEDPCLESFLQGQIHCQIQKFISIFKQRPSHIDSHNHLHTIPKFAQIICHTARLYGIYKVRIPTPFLLHKTGNNNLDNFNKSLVERAQYSKKIYEQYGFLYPSYQIGLDIIGKDFTLQNIKNRIAQIIESKFPHQLSNVLIQIMVHPGYPQIKKFQNYTTCPFSMNIERASQLQTLKWLKTAKFPLDYISYHSLVSQRAQKCLILYSKLVKGSGNLTTARRLHRILSENLGYRVYFLNVSDQAEAHDEVYLDRMLKQLGVKCIIGINLTRTAGVIHRVINGKANTGIGWKIPYLLVVAGTDANVTLISGKKQILAQINQSIRQCSGLISISNKLKQKVEKYLQSVNINKEVKLIVQSSENFDRLDIHKNQAKNCPEQQNSCTPFIKNSSPYIIFPTSFRKIKCPHHILTQLNQLIQKYPTLQCLIAGPIIDQQYYKKTLPLLKKVQYIQCLPHQQYIQVLRNALVLINCSENQGMSCSILEAFSEKVPVIVRKNQGNCELVQEGINGYLYETGQDFLTKFETLFKNYNYVKKNICQNAYKDFTQKYSYQKQCNSYIKLFKQEIEPHLYPLSIPESLLANETPSKTAHILALKNVHGVSPVNLKIFNKFFEYDKNQLNPSVKYIGKIIGHLEDEQTLSILDIGCGSGIFCLFFVLKMIEIFNDSNKIINLRLVFSDIHEDSLKNLVVNIKTLEQLCNTPSNTVIKLKKIEIVQSNMFSELQLNSFNIILANMPQTPFQDQKSRLDKNGGEDGFKLTKQLLQKYQKYLKNSSTCEFNFLLMLYSHMLNDNKFIELAKNNGSAVNWVSQTELHRITREDYDRMEERLAYLIEERVKQGTNGVKIDGNVFVVPAQLRLLQKVNSQ